MLPSTNRLSRFIVCVACIACIALVTPLRADIWILVNDLPEADASIGEAIVTACRANGLSAHSLRPADLNKGVLGKIQDDSLMILTDCGILPVESAPALDEYISGGGKLIFLGGTLFSKQVTTHGGKRLTKDIAFKHRDLLFPRYHTYDCSDVAEINVSRSQRPVMGTRELLLPEQIQAFHPRCKSTGWKKSRRYRWMPLLEAVSPTGQYRGTIAALRFDRNLEHMWAGLAIEEPEFYRHKNTISFIVDLAKRMLDGNFLWEGGSTQWTYFPEQNISVGASAIAKNPQHGLRLELAVAGPVNQQKRAAISTENQPLKLDKLLGKANSFPKGGPYHVEVSLVTKEGVLVDQLEHDFAIWQPNKKLEWITARDGDFYLGDELWHPYGVNYMPSSGIARETNDEYAFVHWFCNEAYDPDVIERDLSRIVDLGMNMVCIFVYNNDIDSWNLIDFLRRCESRHLRVSLSLREVMTRLNFQPAKVKEIIERNHLKINRTVFLYDIAWEYRFQPGYYDFPDTIKDWNKWLANKYGTLEGAIETWGFKPKIETKNGLAIPPTHKQWYQSGDWNKMLGDYSVCLNTILHNRFSGARDGIRSIDANHLVSFRMQYSGDPTYAWGPLVPYDLKGLAGAVDVMQPEAYGRIGPWERVRAGKFTNAYARAVAPKLPVFWPEAGYSVWDTATMSPSPKRQKDGAAFYRDFLRMILESHGNGVAFWWYPGGFRTTENSDYGIINPDGTDRPITKVIREFAPKFENSGPVPTPEVWVEYPRDWNPGGITGSYRQIKDEFWRNIKAGKVTGLKVE